MIKTDNEDKVYATSLLDAGDVDDAPEAVLNEMQIERYELPVGTARRVSSVLAGMMVLFLAWSCFAPIDVVAKAAGQLRPYGKPKLVQSELNGKIAMIAVGEGTQVHKNDVLVTLDSSIRKDEYQQRLLALQQEKIKMQELLQAADALSAILKNPQELPAVVNDTGNVAQIVNDVYAGAKTLSQARYDAGSAGASPGVAISEAPGMRIPTVPGEMSDLRDMFAQLNNERGQKEQQITLLRNQFQKEETQRKSKIAALQEQINMHSQMLNELLQSQNLSRQQESDYAKVLDIGVSQVQYLDAKQKVESANKQVLDEKATIDSLKNDLEFARLDLPRWRLQSDNEILELDSDINKLSGSLRDVQIRMRGDAKTLEQAQSEFNVAMEKARAALANENAQIASEQESLKEAQSAAEESRHMLDQTIITAPMEGIVTGLNVRAPGEVVSQGEQLMQILPAHGDLIVEANVSNAEIGFVHKGETVKLKLDAFPFQDFGILEGKVFEIAQYPQSDGNSGFVYQVRIKPEHMYITNHGKVIPLKNGLTAECDIILRKVSVLQALLRPITGMNYLSIKN